DSSIQLETEFATSLFKRPKLVINVVVTEGGGANGSDSATQSASAVNNRSFNGGNTSLPPTSPRSSSLRSRSSSSQQRETNSMRTNSSVVNTSAKFGGQESSALARSSSGGYQSGSKSVSRHNSGLASVSSNDVDRANQTPGQKDEEIRALKEKQERVELELQRVQEQFATFSSMQAPSSSMQTPSSSMQAPMYSNVGPGQPISPPPAGAQSPALRHSQSVMTKRGDNKGAIGRTHSSVQNAVTIKFNDDTVPDSDSLDDDANSSGMDDAVNGSSAKASGAAAFQQSAYYVNDRVTSGKEDRGGSDLAAHNGVNRSMTQPLEAHQPAPRPRPRPRPTDGFAVPEETGQSPMQYNPHHKLGGVSPQMERSWYNKNSNSKQPGVSRTDSNLSANSEHFDQGLAKQAAHRNNTMQLPSRTSPSRHRSQSQQRSSPTMSHRDMHTQSVFVPGRTVSQGHAQQPKERRVVMDGATVGECSFFHELLDMTKQERHDKLCELFAGRKNGDWLLRYNTEQNSYIITLKYIGTLLHIKIPQDETGTYELGEVAFSRLVDLLSYYSNHRLSEDIPIRLNECVRVQLPTLEGDAGYVVIGPKSNYGG
ncbi:hypothetical protein SARC_10648, partial [Sphaeroforma arctica JP610]